MCDPITIAGVALTGLSSGLNYAAQSKVQNARDDAMAAERIRQGTLDQEAQALNAQSQDRYQDFQGQEDQKAAQLADYFTGQEVAAPSAEAAIPASSSNITVREEQKQRGKATEFTNRTGNALGELRAFGDLLGDVSRLQARDAGQIGQIGGFKRGSSGVLGYELDEAGQAGNGMKLFADLAGGAGSIATSAGLSGGSLFGGGGAAKTAARSVPDPWAGLRNAPSGSSLFNLYGGR